MAFTKTMPTSSPSTKRRRSSASSVQTLAPRPKPGVVGEAQGLVGVVGTVEQGHRAEDLFGRHPHGRGDAGDDGRRVEEAGTVDGRAAAEDVGPLRPGVVDQGGDLVASRGEGQGTDLGGGLHGVSDAETGHALDEGLFEGVVTVTVDDEALGRDAALAVVLDPGGDTDADGVVEIGRRQDHEGVAAAQLEDGLLDGASGRRRPPNDRPPRSRSG